MEGLSEQQEQRSFFGPDLYRQGAVLPARLGGNPDLRETDSQLFAVRRHLRPGYAEDDGAVCRSDAIEGA